MTIPPGVHLEITRADETGEPGWLDADFCSQEHAAQWLEGPVPRPEPWRPGAMTTRDRIASTAFAVAFATIVGLTVLELVTAVRFERSPVERRRARHPAG